MRTSHDVWTDPDLRELVATEPELVAIADAVAYATAINQAVRATRPLRPLRWVAAAAALAAAIAAALVMPWNRSSGSLSDLALAAIGSQPVLHVVGQMPTRATLVDVATGTTSPAYQDQEIWFDATEGLKRSVIRSRDIVVADVLETPDGAYSSNGRVYDCTWIAAHPAEATRAGVSCTASGINPSSPTAVPHPRPTLDPGLSGFVDQYRSELASGRARSGGSGELNGKTIDWLLLDTTDGVERVALDPDTHKPLLVQFPSGLQQRISKVETTGFDRSYFARPKPNMGSQSATGGASEPLRVLPLDEGSVVAAAASARWPGTSIGQLPLVHAELQSLSTSFADDHEQHSNEGLQFDFGTLTNGRLDFSRDYVRVSEAPSRTLGFGYMWGFAHGADPSAGYLYEATQTSSGQTSPGSASSALGFLVKNGTYMTVQASTKALLLEAAKAMLSSGR
ncbi:MAG TPA: hypothetical protein VGO31_10525 [Microbacteriaceae bacterium]|jgi:hypothetical protein|nr:hypothetical protein [Microbacteriaceae bacterium]